jgi:hypothetical protein
VLSRENSYGGYNDDCACDCNLEVPEEIVKNEIHKRIGVYFISGVLAITLLIIETLLYIELKVKRAA